MGNKELKSLCKNKGIPIGGGRNDELRTKLKNFDKHQPVILTFNTPKRKRNLNEDANEDNPTPSQKLRLSSRKLKDENPKPVQKVLFSTPDPVTMEAIQQLDGEIFKKEDDQPVTSPK